MDSKDRNGGGRSGVGLGKARLGGLQEHGFPEPKESGEQGWESHLGS